MALAVSGGHAAARVGATGAAVTGLVLVTLNQGYPYPWSGFTILAMMFTGSLIYRAEDGQAGKVKAAWIAGAVLVLIVIAGLWHGGDRGTQWQLQWASSIVGAAVTFALGLAVRNRRIPRALAWLGLISYSVYLLHPLVLNAYRSIPVLHQAHPIGVQPYLAAAVLAVIIAASAVSYYAVERPMQRLGRSRRDDHGRGQDGTALSGSRQPT